MRHAPGRCRTRLRHEKGWPGRDCGRASLRLRQYGPAGQLLVKLAVSVSSMLDRLTVCRPGDSFSSDGSIM
jgi:hypothetical protein